MAGKARRAAARQGQLNRKRKKSQRGPSGIPGAVVADDEASVDSSVDSTTADSSTNSAVDSRTETETGADAVADSENGVASAEAVATPAPATATPARTGNAPRTAAATRGGRTNSVPQGSGRIRGERPAAYNYVGAELRRISILSVSIITVLVVLGIVL
jgi:hypothetical protein